jgi:ribosomal protein L7/L12
MDAEALKSMTVAELRDEAKKLGDVKGISSMKKDELVELLSGGAKESPRSSHARRPGKAAVLTLSELKQKIRELKNERAAAGARAARAKVDQFNAELRTHRRRLRKKARRRRRATRQAS